MTEAADRRTEIAERWNDLADRLRACGGSEVEVVAVTKGFDSTVVEAAIDVGCRAIGENYAAECRAKLGELADRGVGPPRVHFIGQLQTNKVRMVAGLIDLYESVDRERLIDEIARRQPGAAVLIQVNSTGEPTKGGCDPAEVPGLLEHARTAGLVVRGLMTVGPTSGDAAVTRSAFGRVRELVDRHGLEVCSMGMSDDLEIAVESGSTEIRVGTALFGARPARPDRPDRPAGADE